MITDYVFLTDTDQLFLPPYSPELNPIELIWKSIKRIVSTIFFRNQDEFIETVKTNFIQFAKEKSFCKAWVMEFVREEVQ